MAVAQAQFEVIESNSAFLMDMGKQVIFAIHPVAGRMPGHMNVCCWPRRAWIMTCSRKWMR